ncbi:TlyA family rRNA (cytidine-2'-O)-methyltransferase [Kushneria pakistanensis]|uniref:TlyA family rRNA (Cytidine-2'-O)-methyltransferase n=1 Tax=Kushneria pakistanensis TaxID=1508770 RepID=A0ABQ3FN80_9GAMM|nr:TlyA family RNA methyltransferase [Kushneria pakistanensis]GHC31141.1 TlyA family rRNA (cytidine-2'-O)-methyltransferase [Kushneria pakistanensis]
MVRVDQLLVAQALVRSRTRAQRLIRHGRVQLMGDGQPRTLTRPGEKLPEESRFHVVEDPEERYVSRAGLKLEALLAATGITPQDLTLLDVGQSTGGFTDCLLHHGAARVIGIEVGHGQLDPMLREDSRVHCLEGVNARQLPTEQIMALAPDGIAGAVMDVSFISQTLILPELARLLPAGAHLLSLVKPQFELSPEQIGSGGIVRDARHFDQVETRLRMCCEQTGFSLQYWGDSPITGGDGNREFLMHATRTPS